MIVDRLKSNIKQSLGVALFLLLAACSSAEKKADTPEELFKLANFYESGNRYEEALRRYNDIRQRFPYSNYAVEADLKVADVYYTQESYAEAQLAYESFREQRPQHEKSDYVLFRIGMSYYQQLPSTIDRDLSLAPSAIRSFEDLIEYYPLSTHVPEAKEKMADVQDRLVQKAQYIADFYFKRGSYQSALERYEQLAKAARNPTTEIWALKRGAESAKKIGDLEKFKALEGRLKQQYPKESIGEL